MTQQQTTQYTWDDLVAAVGLDFSEGEIIVGEPIYYSDVRRFTEVWEIANPIYYDEAVAKQAAGYRGIVVPWSGVKQTFVYPANWRPGRPTVYPTPDKHASGRGMASFSPRGKPLPKPSTTTGIVTHMEIEFLEPVIVGDVLTVKGAKLIEARPRQTRIGYGAFTTTESEIYNQLGQLVAIVRGGGYSYNPGPAEGQGSRGA